MSKHQMMEIVQRKLIRIEEGACERLVNSGKITWQKNQVIPI